jgi:hypothetical protein
MPAGQNVFSAMPVFKDVFAERPGTGAAKKDGPCHPDITSLHITEKEKTWN